MCAGAGFACTLRDGGKTDDDRLAFAFRRCVARRPTAAELTTLQNRCWRRSNSIFPRREQSRGSWPRPIRPIRRQLPAGATPAQLAAWTVVSRVILNLDETITKD